MNKKILWAVVSLLLVIIIYFGYKAFYLYCYGLSTVTNGEYSDIISGLSIKDTISLQTKQLDENEYLEFNEISIRNDFKDFKKLDAPESTNEYVKYVLYDGDKLVSAFWMGVTDTYVSRFNSEKDIASYGIDDRRFDDGDRKYFFEANNIETDIELFEFLAKSKDFKSNLFTSFKDIRTNGYINYLVTVALPSLKDITLIEGSYNGYIFNTTGDIKQVCILKNGKMYFFTFIKLDYFTDEYIKELLNTIIID